MRPFRRRGDVVRSGERQIGVVTSATHSAALGRPIAIGYVHRDFAEPSTSVVVRFGEGRNSPRASRPCRSSTGGSTAYARRRGLQPSATLAKHLDQLRVRRRKSEIGERVTRDPTHLLPEKGLRFAEKLAPEEVQFHGPVGVRVAHLEDLGRHPTRRPRALPESPVAGRSRCDSPGLALPTGKLPQAFQVHTAGSSGDEERVVSLDDGRRYDNRWARWRVTAPHARCRD